MINYLKRTNSYFLKHMKKMILITASIFLLVAIIAYVAVMFMPEDKVYEVFAKISESIDWANALNDDGTLSFTGIFFNNLRVGALMVIIGIIPFFFIPMWIIISNGAALGGMMGVVDVMTHENVFMAFIKYILPHGVFELPAIIIAGAMGLKISLLILRKIFRRGIELKFSEHIERIIVIFAIYVIPLLLIAAFIEAVVLEAIY